MPSTAEEPRILAGFTIESVAERTDYVNMLIYGGTGAGKTRLAGSAQQVERMSPVLMLDIEGGTKTLRSCYPDVDAIHIKDQFDNGRLTRTAWDALTDVFLQIRKGVPYKTIVIDSTTELFNIMGKAHLKKMLQEDSSRDPDVLTLRDYLKLNAQMKSFTKALLDLPYHIIFTALEQEVKDERTGALFIKPDLSGKLVNQLPAQFDEVLYLKADSHTNKETKEREIRRFLLTQPDGKHMAKDRSDRLPFYVANPTMADIAQHILD